MITAWTVLTCDSSKAAFYKLSVLFYPTWLLLITFKTLEAAYFTFLYLSFIHM